MFRNSYLLLNFTLGTIFLHFFALGLLSYLYDADALFQETPSTNDLKSTVRIFPL